ncbi:MAG: pitrilysin family protein [Rhodoblastus sp.]|jgi:predicted Zn-dependent peptidase
MSVETTSLPSGLRIVTDRMEGAETAAVAVYVAVGSRNESAAEHGLSHLIEHMAFKGTKSRDARAIAAEIEEAGGDLNAETASEHTAYLARLLPGEVDRALEIFADILTDSVFDPQELDREKNVVLQEIAAVEDDPDDLVMELMDKAAFPDQPLGRPILGTKKTVKSFDAGMIRAYLDRFYGANSLIVSAAGAVRHDEIVRAAERLFGAMPQVAPPAYEPARYRGGEARSRHGAEQANVVIAFEGVGHRDTDACAAHVFSGAVGGGMSSRLFQEVREKRGLAYSIDTFNWSYDDTGLFGLQAATDPRDAAELAHVAMDCMASAVEDLDEAELRRAKAQAKVSLLAALESSPSRVNQIARQTAIFGRVLARSEIIGEIDGLTLAGVRAVGRRLLSSAPTLATVGPTGRGLTADRVAERLRTG